MFCDTRKRRRTTDDGDHANNGSSSSLPNPDDPPSSPLATSPLPLSPSSLPAASTRSLFFLPSSPISLSPYDLARKLSLDKSHLLITGHKGYRTVSATHGLSAASLYWEFTYRPKPGVAGPPCAVRVGVSTERADVDGCVGMDRWGYGISSRGWRGHDGVWEEWDDGGQWEPDTVIGVWLQLGGQDDRGERGKLRSKKQIALDDSAASPSPSLSPTPPCAPAVAGPALDPTLTALLAQQQAAIFCLGSSLSFFRNGKPLGTAFTNLLRGAYFPAFSLYYGAEVDVSFGPAFKAVPEEVHGGWWPPVEGEEGRQGRVELARRGVLHTGEGWDGGGLVMNPRHVALEKQRDQDREEEQREKERRAIERERERERETRDKLEKGKERDKDKHSRDAYSRKGTAFSAM